MRARLAVRGSAFDLHRASLSALNVEVLGARCKFPKNQKLLAALVEEVGELARALLQRRPTAEIDKEALQVACVAMRIYEEGDADFAVANWKAAK